MNTSTRFTNPFRPGAGHMPPYLAGRDAEKKEFARLLKQDTILENMILTGLRGVGKTVLLETLKPIAISEGWAWVGTDLSETSSLSEENIALRLLTDLSVFTSSIVISSRELQGMGFGGQKSMLHETLDFNLLQKIYSHTPGLVADKVKQVLETVWRFASHDKLKGIIFAYDEAQTMADHSAKDQYPLSLLLDVFQSIQRKGIPFMLLLTGLPTLYPKLVEARTFSERMFHVVFLDRLDDKASREAILTPIKSSKSSVTFDDKSVNTIVEISGGYPYFIQFICREVYDVFIQQLEAGKKAAVPIQAIVQKLDTDFFSGRWARATDRQRELLGIIAQLPNSDSEFTVQELVEQSNKALSKPFGGSHANQMLVSLADAGLVYKNRHGKYSFAVPLLGKFILRQMEHADKKLF
jgi:hypothetical protein